MASMDGDGREAALDGFCRRFPIDEDAKNRLRALPQDAFQRVLDDFRPSVDSNPDFSRRLVGFLKGFRLGGHHSGASGSSAASGAPGHHPGAPGTLPVIPPVPAKVTPIASLPSTSSSAAAIVSLANLLSNAAGGGDLGLGVSRLQSASVFDRSELQMFRRRFPMDDRAFDYLQSAPGEVQTRVLNTFKPPSVQDDYSRLVTAHTKFCLTKHHESRGTVIMPERLNHATPAVVGIGGCGGGCGGGETKRHAVSALAAAAALLGGGAIGGSQDATLWPENQANEVEIFRSHYPMDDTAFEYLRSSPPEVVARVVNTFKPPSIQQDYSKIVTSHVRWCRSQHSKNAGTGNVGAWSNPGVQVQLPQVQVPQVQLPQVQLPQVQLPQVQVPRAASIKAVAPPSMLEDVLAKLTPLVTASTLPAVPTVDEGPPLDEELQNFKALYPMDERAFDYLKIVPRDVQITVLTSFRPPATAQDDYSRIITAHIKSCLNQHKEQAAGGPAQASFISVTQAAAALNADINATNIAITQETLEAFRANNPMDDRAFDYLLSAPPAVQERVISTFNADLHQTDYSRMVTAHVKFCWKQHKEREHAPIQLPRGADAEQGVAMLAEFRRKYPTDERAWNYLLQSSSEVKQRVLAEFSPPHSADGDFSRSVTFFVRRCRDDEKQRVNPPIVRVRPLSSPPDLRNMFESPHKRARVTLGSSLGDVEPLSNALR